VTVTLSHTPSYIVSPREKEKEKKRNINNDLAILPSHDKLGLLQDYAKQYCIIYNRSILAYLACHSAVEN